MPERTNSINVRTTESTVESVNQGLCEMDLNAPGEDDKSKVVQATETFAASQASQNAQMALHDPLTPFRTPRTHVSEGEAFPFPIQTQEESRIRRERNRSASFTNRVPNQDHATMTTSPLHTPKHQQQTQSTTPVPSKSRAASAGGGGGDKIDPHVLLVDDNKINLKLLETYLRTKRKYTNIAKAEDGEQAVKAVESAEEPFDVIFMDISMPVMNGFEATRAIREFEDTKGTDPGSMIIALTGLASGKDQTEVFDSGCDIYMTKPVSFKEVGKLLNHWEAHQNLATPDANGAPHGAVVAKSPRLEISTTMK
jgi:CheY-like chemotaxis protein